MSHPLADFYRGKRVLVTGHTGFQGGWAVATLKTLGAQVYGYGLPPATRPNFFDATLLDRDITSSFSDVRDRNSLAKAFGEFQPEIVLHCGLRSNPQFATREPVETFSTNVMGTVHILEEARLTESVHALVIVNSVHARDDFANTERPGMRDASMTCSESARAAFQDAFLRNSRAAAATACAPDAIGGGDWGEGRIVPNLVRSLMAGEPVQILDGPKLLAGHVLDAIYGYLLLAQKLFQDGQKYSGLWHFSPGARRMATPADLAKKFLKLWDAKAKCDLEDARQEERPLSSEIKGKARTELGWSELLSADCALRWAVEWYRDFYADSSLVWRTTENQIERFTKSLPILVEA
ncbi:MAG TPA: NAD-dependent epimerase/dehydratase family protein [Terriglobales bacterium]|nr:NAD-dependent epimerase/dehydratase family protein [Terriglobales bacterium]